MVGVSSAIMHYSNIVFKVIFCPFSKFKWCWQLSKNIENNLVRKKGNSLKEMSGENKVEVRLRPADNNWTGGDLGAGGAIAEHSVSTLPASKFIWSSFLFSLLCLKRLCWIFYLLAFQPYPCWYSYLTFLFWYHYFGTLFHPFIFEKKNYFSFWVSF